ncbi:hypothetical protein KL86DYS1_10828 [uncultured Dysgonomonas sp.]|uniref:Uncharacterized protein n=1 Tax=uncultured Dysgonomonas sp. TaxID=206096 RepID=A0A212J1E0_9BACT|nr:hypothetical protein KL86DYS1_10828 [uncultured Dysgonomonas sp.]
MFHSVQYDTEGKKIELNSPAPWGLRRLVHHFKELSAISYQLSANS